MKKFGPDHEVSPLHFVNLEVLRSPVLGVLKGMLVLVLLCLIFCFMNYQMLSMRVLDCRKVSSGPRLFKVNPCCCNGCRVLFSIVLLKYAIPYMKKMS